MTSRSRLALVAAAALSACGGQAGPPRHPIGEMTARATAKLELLDLVVEDPARAARLRNVYLRAWQLGRDFDLDRAHSLAHARAASEKRRSALTAGGGPEPSPFEGVLAPPIEVGRSTYERYVALMLEARSLLTEDEFQKLDAVR